MATLKAGNDPNKWPQPDLAEVVNLCSMIAEKKDWMGKRDAAMIAIIGMFGKRAGEVTRLQRKDIVIGPNKIGKLPLAQGEFGIHFQIQKAQSPAKKRCKCGKVNSAKNVFCSECGKSMKNALLIPKKRAPVDKYKLTALSHPLARFLFEWLKEIPRSSESYIFPRSNIDVKQGEFPDRTSSRPVWNTPLSRRAPWRVLQTVDKSVWPHLLRHILANELTNRKDKEGNYVYDEKSIIDFFDWSNRNTYLGYIALGGEKRAAEVGRNVGDLFKG